MILFTYILIALLALSPFLVFLYYTLEYFITKTIWYQRVLAAIERQRYNRPRGDHAFIHKLLSQEFPYYKTLDRHSQLKFVFRIQQFRKRKRFDGRKGLVINERIKTIISATAVQVSFGLKEYKLSHFYRIIIYPAKYYSRFTESYNRGEVHSGGAVIFSWEDFLKGIADPHDTFNVGLHEFAHAYNLNNLVGQDKDRFFSGYYDRWYAHALSTMKEEKKRTTPFFRKYAIKNSQELFAVGVEYFFENPVAFKEELPELYHQFCVLLNQDPANPNNIFYFTYKENSLWVKSKHKIHTTAFSYNPFIIIWKALAYASHSFRLGKVDASTHNINALGNILVLFLIIGTFSFIFRFIYFFFGYKQFVLYKDRLKVVYPLRLIRRAEVYSLDKIISINKVNYENIRIAKHTSGRIIHHFKYGLFNNSMQDLAPIFSYLFHDKQVLILDDGHIDIPKPTTSTN